MDIIKAVVGVLDNDLDQILIAKRQDHQFMAGYWELPGGKIDPGETQQQAIVREMNEELGIQVNKTSLHQRMIYQYPDRVVELSIYRIEDYQNTPYGKEGQAVAWVDIEGLSNYQLLPTMRAFIHSITLPKQYWITPSTNHQSDDWLAQFEQKIQQGIKLIQLRSKVALDREFIQHIYIKCQQHNVNLLLNIPNKSFNEPYANGWHMTTQEMLSLKKRPCADDKLLGASTHTLEEALSAQKIGADFVVISPVQATQTHPDTLPIGWDKAAEVVDKLNIPVYFLGGMGLEDLDKTHKLGAQGIAGVSAF